MKKFLCTFFLCMLTAVTLTASAFAAEDIIKAGLYFGSEALYSANLENYEGSGYFLGWFDEDTREFIRIGALAETAISMTAVTPSSRTPYRPVTLSPSGPVTDRYRMVPPMPLINVSTVPSPPSASGQTSVTASGKTLLIPAAAACPAS